MKEEELEYLTDELYELNTQIFGYAGFTQDDPRIYDLYKEHEILLLQIPEEEDYIFWGDSGVANFFITKEDLKKKDFSRVLYNWGCY